MKYYICENNAAGNCADIALKVRKDINILLERSGYKAINIDLSTGGAADGCGTVCKVKRGLDKVLGFKIWFEKTKIVKSGDIVFVQYPPREETWIANLLFHLKMRGAYIIGMIHELGSFCSPSNGLIKSWKYYEDVNSFAFFDQIIVHNMKMKKVMDISGYDYKKIITLKLFDYLPEGLSQTKDKCSCKDDPVVYVQDSASGETSSFLKKGRMMGHGIKIDCYSTTQLTDDTEFEGVEYKGYASADEIVDVVDGSFGLVWDECGIDPNMERCDESLSIYTSKKLSLYLAASIPVIVWRRSAMADFVWDYSLGLVVDRLGDIKEKIAALPDDEYKKMKDNVRCVSKAVHNGGFFAKALERAELSL